MMKRLYAVLLSVMLLGMMGVASAAGNSLKIGVIDLREIMQKSPQVKTMVSKLKSQFKPRQDKIVALQKKLDEDLNKLKRDSAVMKKAEKAKVRDRVMTARRDLQQMEQNYQQDLRMAQGQAMDKFYKKVSAAVKTVAKRDGYDLVMQKGAVPYASDRALITEKVLKELS